MKIRIYYEDTDAGGIVYHANYIKFCERARSEMFFSSGISFDESGYFVVSAIDAKFIKPAILGDEIEIKTKILTLKKATLELEQEIFRVGNLNSRCEPIMLFAAKITCAFMRGRKPCKMSDEIAEFLASYR